MNDMKKMMEQYRNDPTFHRVVKALKNIIDECQLTPHEVRQAATFASYIVELENPRPVYVGIDPAFGPDETVITHMERRSGKVPSEF